MPTQVVVSQDKWRDAVKFLTGLGTNLMLTARDQHQLRALMGRRPLSEAQARAALRAAGWSAEVHENDFLVGDGTREAWEGIRAAIHFNVFRLERRAGAGTLPVRHTTTYPTFPAAVLDAARDISALVYAVTAAGASFCNGRSG